MPVDDLHIYIISDSTGETAERVVEATLIQFNRPGTEVSKYSHIEDIERLAGILDEVQEKRSLIVYTIIIPELREFLREEAEKRKIPMLDIMGPFLDTFSSLLGIKPQLEPGLNRQITADYYRRVESIEFAVRCDDGRDLQGILEADLVITGVSRTSKTPLSMYLAYRGLKVANLPLVPEVHPPEQLFQIPSERIIGLDIEPGLLQKIRRERMKTLNLGQKARYVRMDRILEELEYAEELFKKLRCYRIDVTNKSIEESASEILEVLNRRKVK